MIFYSFKRMSVYLNEYEVVTVLGDAKICSTSERYSKNIGAQRSPIIVDNTNIKCWEMTEYLKIAVKFGYLVEIVQPNTPWSQSVDALVKRNIHDVPRKTI